MRDGNTLLAAGVFASEQDGRNHLYSVSADSKAGATAGAATLLTPGDFDVEHVALSRDRNSVLYSSNQDDVERRHLWRVSAAGGKPQTLTHGESAEWSPVEAGTKGREQVVCLGSTATSPAMPYAIAANGLRAMIASARCR